MRFPDFFIAGAPKCGTTSLYEYLRPHPGIFMPFPKEPNYYSPDVRNLKRVGKRDDYLALFREAPAGVKCGEGSTFYLYSHQAVPDLLKDNPQARLIICLRDPVGMFVSYHNQVLFGRRETIADPEAAWRAHNSCANTGDDPLSRLDYGAVCNLGAQVERLLTKIAREQVYFVLFDDIMGRAQAVYESALEFLGVPSDGRVDFQAYHQRKAHRFPTLANFVKHPPFPFNHIKNGLRKMFHVSGREAPHLYEGLLTMSTEKPVLRSEFRAELLDYFANDTKLLERLIGRDLSAWRSM